MSFCDKLECYALVPGYQKPTTGHQNEVLTSSTSGNITYLAAGRITLAAILDFSVLCKLLEGESSTPIWMSF